jgi:6-phosphofructokinase 2
VKHPLIVTLTMNPALDITTEVDVVRATDKMRCADPRYDPGGGGINAARVAGALGASVSAVFPAGGHAGGMVVDLVRRAGLPIHRVHIADSTRESFTINERSTGKQFRFVLPGPVVTVEEQARCLDRLRSAAASADFIVASGSLPPGVPPDFYQRVADLSRELRAQLILDTSGGGLSHVTSGVFLVKPSVRELREYVGRPLESEADQVAAARELIGCGMTQAVVVSLGAEGALLVTSTSNQRFSAIPVRSGSGVGAGDAMVAAITVGLSRGWPLIKSVRYGIAAGAAMSMTPGTETCRRSDVERLLPLVDEPVGIGAAVSG